MYLVQNIGWDGMEYPLFVCDTEKRALEKIVELFEWGEITMRSDETEKGTLYTFTDDKDEDYHNEYIVTEIDYFNA